ncbi:MerR family transcriptional regulator [Shouchella clausii]|nr:MerR family transcriptional regulator [Shouchella clausii]
MIKIGQLAKKIGISKKTLYHFENVGILKPSLIKDGMSTQNWTNF